MTSDYMYVLDIYGGEIMEYYSQPEYVDITVTPFGKILVTDGYGIEMFANTKISDMENIVLPINADNLKFVEWRENILKISCFEFEQETLASLSLLPTKRSQALLHVADLRYYFYPK